MNRIEARGYMSGALTNLSSAERPSVLRFYEEIAALGKEHGIDVCLPHKHSDPFRNAGFTPRQVYKMDEARVKAATVMITEVTRPSFGGGFELMMCWRFGTQVVLLCERERLRILKKDPVEKQIFLNPAIQAIIPYKDFSDALQKLKELFDEKAEEFKHKIALPPIPSVHEYMTKWAGKVLFKG